MNIEPTTSPRQLSVLFIGLKYDYGVPERGESFEHATFFDVLTHMNNVQATLFPFDEITRARGRKEMNAHLLDTVAAMKPDICFFFLFTDEISGQTIQTISDRGDTITLNWFADDHWRFEPFSRHWAHRFHWVVTTDRDAMEKYQRIGYRNVIRSQWGVNHFRYKPISDSKKYEVTFVGQNHSTRKSVVEKLARRGIHVDCWGRGWDNGRVSTDEMIAIFSSSTINLNFTDSSIVFNRKQAAKIFLNRRADDTYRFNAPREILGHVKTLLNEQRVQIKGRNFEVPATGGFLLTQHVDGIEEYFVPGKEIATFTSVDDLCEKVRYYLAHDQERESIRKAGYERALREHTLEQRFNTIFTKVTAVDR